MVPDIQVRRVADAVDALQFFGTHSIRFSDGVQSLPFFYRMVDTVGLLVVIIKRFIVRRATAIGEGQTQHQANGKANRNLSEGDHGGRD